MDLGIRADERVITFFGGGATLDRRISIGQTAVAPLSAVLNSGTADAFSTSLLGQAAFVPPVGLGSKLGRYSNPVRRRFSVHRRKEADPEALCK